VCGRDATLADLEVVVSWIGSQRECELRAGPGIPFPVEPGTLPAEIDMPGALNVALEDEHGLATFGRALPRSPGRAQAARKSRPRRWRGARRVTPEEVRADRRREAGVSNGLPGGVRTGGRLRGRPPVDGKQPTGR